MRDYFYEGSSDSDNKDLDTHPVIKLTTELIVLITFRLNRLSRNYRFVHKVLSAEKNITGNKQSEPPWTLKHCSNV